MVRIANLNLVEGVTLAIGHQLRYSVGTAKRASWRVAALRRLHSGEDCRGSRPQPSRRAV